MSARAVGNVQWVAQVWLARAAAYEERNRRLALLVLAQHTCAPVDEVRALRRQVRQASRALYRSGRAS